jgi:hypothetical protein
MRHDVLPTGLPPALAGLQEPCYLHHPPAWKFRTLLAVALLVVMGGLGFVALRALRGDAGTDELLLAAMLLPFFGLLVRPSLWRLPISLAVDTRGLHFLGSDPRGSPVFVPWSDVGPTTIERVSSEGSTVVLTIADGSSFWDAAKQSHFNWLLLGAVDAEGRRRLIIGSQGIAPEVTQAALESLRSRAT